MRKSVLVFALVTVLLMCTACRHPFAEQEIAVAGWSYIDKSPGAFRLGDFEVVLLANGEEGRVDFRVKDRSSFLLSILHHPGFVRQEYNDKQNPVYVFLDSGNYHLLVEAKSNKKQGEYFLRPAVSRYFDADGTTYEFPLYDCSIRYDGQVFFHEGQNTVKNQNDWQYFVRCFEALPRDCITIDESEKSVLLSVTKVINGEQIIDDAQKIKIVYQSDGTGSGLVAGLTAKE